MYLGSQAPLYQNVRVRCIDPITGKCRVERTAKNRITRLMLWGISKFLSGEFNDSTPDIIYEYIPRYLAFGTNTPGSNSEAAGVTSIVTVNDTQLMNEITMASSTGETTSVKRISIQSRQHMKTSTRFTDPFVKLSLMIYVSSHQFDNMEIGEAGLFTKEQGNNCVARVVFAPFQKKSDEVIEICWDITLLSYGTTKYPDNISIDTARKIIIPLYYSPYFIRSTPINLVYIKEFNDQGWLYLKTDSMNLPLFRVNTDGSIDVDDSLIKIDSTTLDVSVVSGTYSEDIIKWSNYLESQNIKFDNVVRQLVIYGKKSGDNIIFESSNSVCSMYLSESERLIDNVMLLADNEGALLQDNKHNFIAVQDAASATASGKGLYVSRIYKQEDFYEAIDTGYVISNEMNAIVDIDNNVTEFIIHNRQIYRKQGDLEMETGAYLESGHIMYEDSPTDYVYDTTSGVISKMEHASSSEAITSAFVIPEADKYKIYQTSPYQNVTNYLNYWIEWSLNKAVYSETGENTEYHITNDLFFASGDTYKLPYTISPTDATDRTVSWSSLNSEIAPVNQFGIVSGWNVGETFVTVTTSNGVKARTTIEVVKNLEVVKTSHIEINPAIMSFDANSADPQTTIVTAFVYPLSATYNVVSWTMDSNASQLFSFAPLKDNKVKVWYNGNNNVGRGYITATTADGVNARCLLQALSTQPNEDDCPSDEHNDQHIS